MGISKKTNFQGRKKKSRNRKKKVKTGSQKNLESYKRKTLLLIMELMLQNDLLKLSYDILGVGFHRTSEKNLNF